MKIQTFNSFTDPKIVAHIEEQHQKGLSTAKLLATTHVLSGKPPKSGGYLNLYTEPIHSFYNSILADINDLLNSKLQIQLGVGNREKKIVEDKVILQHIAEEESKHVGGNTNTNYGLILMTLSKFTLSFLMCVGIFLADWIYLSRSLQVLTENYLTAMFLGFGIALGNIIICHFGEAWISKNVTNRLLRRLLRVLLVLIVISVFIGLGIVRQHFLKQSSHKESPLYVFVGINMLFFIAIFLIMEMSLNPIMPEIKRAFREFITRFKSSKKAKKIAKLKGMLTVNRNALNTYLEERLCIIAFHHSCEAKIERYFKEAIALYRQTIINGTDGEGVPECLMDETPQLNFLAEHLENKKS